MKHYYYGCFRESGHHWFSTEDGNLVSYYYFEFPQELEFIKKMIDGNFTPAHTMDEGIANMWVLSTGPGQWTILSFWDYSVDSRGNSNSNFIFEGEHSFDETILLMNKYFPTIMKRFSFEIKMREDK